jgi:hypothetical protein
MNDIEKLCEKCGAKMEYVDSPFKKPPVSSATVTSDKVWKCTNPKCGAVLRW